MEWLKRFLEKWNAFAAKVGPVFSAVGRFFRRLGRSFATIGSYLYKLRSIILAAPIAAVAAVLAAVNLNRLPETLALTMVSIDTQADGSLFGFLAMNTEYIARELAVFGPLMITIVCLLLMLCSKRTLYPFLISAFSLCLPIIIWLFNVYPM